MPISRVNTVNLAGHYQTLNGAPGASSLEEGRALLDRFADRLRHVHLSSLDQDGHHVPLTGDDEELFTGLLERCRNVPWILEAPLR